MDKDVSQMTTLSGVESYGGTGAFKGLVFIGSEKYDDLPEKTQHHISYKASNYLAALRELINMEWAKVNEADKRQEHVEKLTEIFKLAGFDPIHVETIDSQYCSEACCYKYPWVIITTEKGRIKLGWRKRVMNLDWSDSDIKLDGEEIFKDENVTKGKSFIHCWGTEKAIEYLKKLNSKG